MKIILAGYMGSGKSSVGKLLAQKRGYSFKDLDEEICKSEGKEISEIFSTSGEIYFRKKEAEVLQELLALDEDFILSLGGGTPCYGKNLEVIKKTSNATMVYLKASLQELKKRLMGERSSRPLISQFETPELLEEFIGKHLFERSYYYNQSDFIIPTDGKAVEEVAKEIQQALN